MNKVSNLLLAVLAVCSVTVTSLVVRREFSARNIVQAERPQRIANWAAVQDGPHRFGNQAAAVQIVVFSDFQCPFCARFTLNVLRSISEKYGDRVQYIFRHWPLPSHPYALISARAAECAAAQDRFEQFHDQLFLKQDSIGVKSFVDFARDSFVPDSEMFEACLQDESIDSTILHDKAMAEATGGVGTPTVIVNGWRLFGTPSLNVLDSVVSAQLEGK